MGWQYGEKKKWVEGNQIVVNTGNGTRWHGEGSEGRGDR